MGGKLKCCIGSNFLSFFFFQQLSLFQARDRVRLLTMSSIDNTFTVYSKSCNRNLHNKYSSCSIFQIIVFRNIDISPNNHIEALNSVISIGTAWVYYRKFTSENSGPI